MENSRNAVERLQKILHRHPHKFLQRLDFLLLGGDEMLLRGGFALHFRLGQRAQAVLQLVVDVLRDERHFFDDLLLEAKFGKGRLQLPVGILESRQRPLDLGLAVGLAPGGIFVIHLLIQFLDARDQPAQRPQMRFPAVHLFVQHDAVKAFARRLGQQFFRERDVFLAGKTEAVNDLA